MTRQVMRRLAIAPPVALTVLTLASGVAGAQQAPPATPDTLRLDALQLDAVRRDPRGEQLELLAARTALRLRTLDAERLPTLGLNSQGQYQSDVLTFPFQLSGGVTPPVPPKDSYDANLAARQRLYDPTRGRRREVERAQLAESRALVRTALFPLRQSVNDAFFAALLLQAQRAELATGIADLDAQLRLAAERVRAGTALPSETAILEAELLRRRQSLAELTANRSAALTVLGELTGRVVAESDVLALPDLEAEVARARATLPELRARPEYERFARSREALGRQEEAVAAQDRPRL
jgi:outer membrane protein TolC